MFDDDVTEHEIVTSLLSFFLILGCRDERGGAKMMIRGAVQGGRGEGGA